METEKYNWVTSDITTDADKLTFELGTQFNFNADVLLKKNTTFEGDVTIGRDYSSKTLTVYNETKFTNHVSFNNASGNFILLSGSIIPDEALRYTTVIKDLEKLADALRKDYFYKHFYEWIGIETNNKIED